ncbi:MAG: hypothetical protein JO112_20230 [Planctomycetes bacterium]|nr:hypothetical protein [Planctomycetota bacterium]
MIKTALLLITISALPACQACGYSSQQNDLTGQVKKVISRTPLVCPDYTEVDVSMGVLRNGVGSLSKEDLILFVRNPQDIPTLKKAALEGDIVEITYNDFRASICEPTEELTSVQITK